MNSSVREGLARRAGYSKAFAFAGVFLVCMCGLMLQIMETRLLSVMAWYYLAFFAISMAMFGMTAGSLLVYFQSKWFVQERLLEHLTWIAMTMAIVIVYSTYSLATSVVVTDVGLSGAFLWLKLILTILPPYVLMGMAISLALTRSPWPIGQVYGVDLIGAASGCLAGLAILSWLDGVSALFMVGAIAALAASFFRMAWHATKPEVASLAVTKLVVFCPPAMLAVLLAAVAVGNNAIQPRGIVPLVVKNRLHLNVPAVQKWNSFSQVRVDHEANGPPAMWGKSSQMPPFAISQRWMEIDGSAGTAMYRYEGQLSTLDFLRYDITNLAYAIRHSGRAAIIGVGGGRDLLSAYLFGFQDVTGVELNPIFTNLLTGQMRDFNHVADQAGVKLYVDEARSWFARTTEKFDLIEMSMIDTWAATGAGAFSLSENGLYTIEGWSHFLNALTPHGVFTVSRWFNPHDVRETSRLLSLALAALRARGDANPAGHVFLAGASNLSTIIVANEELSAEELVTLRAAVNHLGFTVLASPDQRSEVPILDDLMQSAGNSLAVNALVQRYRIDLTAPTDDRPFFFNQLLLTNLISLQQASRAQTGVIRGNLQAVSTIAMIALVSLILVVITMVLPTLPSVRRVDISLSLVGSMYFLLIGLGFMFIEIAIIQRVSLFLGHPIYGLAIGLFGIILSTGFGSLLSEWLPLTNRAKMIGWSLGLSVFVLLLAIWFPVLVHKFEDQPIVVRALVTLTAMVPSGLLMGYGFPTGMRLVDRIDRRPTPWFWAVNGSAGVLAASVAVGISIIFSISASLVVGAVCYLLVMPAGLALSRLQTSNRVLSMADRGATV